MKETILSREVKVENNEVVITKSTETKLTQQQLDIKLRDIQMQKNRIKEQNTRFVEEYNALTEEESELRDLINQLASSETMQEI